jgi:hypothetical protein
MRLTLSPSAKAVAFALRRRVLCALPSPLRLFRRIAWRIPFFALLAAGAAPVFAAFMTPFIWATLATMGPGGEALGLKRLGLAWGLPRLLTPHYFHLWLAALAFFQAVCLAMFLFGVAHGLSRRPPGVSIARHAQGLRFLFFFPSIDPPLVAAQLSLDAWAAGSMPFPRTSTLARGLLSCFFLFLIGMGVLTLFAFFYLLILPFFGVCGLIRGLGLVPGGIQRLREEGQDGLARHERESLLSALPDRSDSEPLSRRKPPRV